MEAEQETEDKNDNWDVCNIHLQADCSSFMIGMK
jgi:hypothetical protein